ncbi:3-isopropylmalate dehydratase small subunit [Paraburkholderia kururiensis]|uniref:3-isopropylmalate dehydratase small subunit n=1 Tax=Paraburkholderia kururiensis TaxID=984307 RepID=UPI00034D0386|nr:3-isopropylmalate dehydratase small subunit [Paraburkholderia kururiensis]
MTPFTLLDGLVVPIERANVDTDALIPKQFMKSVRRTGFGDNLFDEWRYLDRGQPGLATSARRPNPAFVLNQARYAGAQIMLCRENFGCGSSREHAVWALHDFGIRAMVGPSFADIFHGNCLKNGMLPIVLPAAVVDRLFADTAATPGYRLIVDLASQRLRLADGSTLDFDVASSVKHRLINGLDEIGLTLARAKEIGAYEARRRIDEPWLFTDDHAQDSGSLRDC